MIMGLLAAGVLLLALSYFLAKCFAEVAEEKGYYDDKYFWICFLLNLPGWLLVVALPDRNIQQMMEDNLPSTDRYESSTMADNQMQPKVEGFTSGVMNIPKRK